MRCTRIVTLFWLVVAGAGPSVHTQPLAPAFEVASVKPSPPGDDRTFWAVNPSSATFAVTNAEVRAMVARAYGIPPVLDRFILTGGSDKVLLTRFDIRAKPPENATPDQRTLMLRSLLAERFRLRTHTEIRQMPIYALTVARAGRFGPNFRSSEHSCIVWAAARSQAAREGRDIPAEPKDANGRGWCLLNYDFNQDGGLGLREAGPLAQLVTKVQAFLDRPLVDATGLTGNFEWQLAFTLSETPPIDSPVPTISTAFEEQLGLKLERRTGPMEVRVIDSVEMPTPD